MTGILAISRVFVKIWHRIAQVSPLVTAVIIALAALGLLAWLGFLAARYFYVPRFPDEIHYTTSSDGWRLAILRYRTEGRPPVLLVHGLAANASNFDLGERSFARSLAAEGWDVWVLELRGRGLSTRPLLFSKVRYDWTFDEYAERDLPAACDEVLRATGARRLHLCGFSTGALACYAFLSDPHRKVDVASLVSIGGPATFKRASRAVSGRLVRNLRWLRHRSFLRLIAPLTGWFHPISLFYNPENIDGPLTRRALVNMIANFSRNELLQYGDWVMHDTFRSIDHRRDYRAELSRITVPALLLAGPRDALAPPDAVKHAYDALGSTEKQFQICSRAQGFTANYGHFDLIVGKAAPQEIYPRVAAFLSAQESSSGLTSASMMSQ
jgi:pimeloyl-ACP methyl ester carboxylesterase